MVLSDDSKAMWPQLTDANKLRIVAAWFDLHDQQTDNENHEVQDDLRRMAREMDGN